MFKRKLVSQLADRLTEQRRFIQIIVGPRQTGKTTAVSQALEDAKEEGFKVYWWRDRSDEVDFVIQKCNLLTAIEVKSGKIKGTGGSLVFKRRYPEALSIIVGSANYGLEEFLLGSKPLFNECR
jgi:predicted AAA+ superfamily ATPase